MKKDKKNMITSTIATLILLLVTAHATFAYFTSTMSKTDANFTVITSNEPTFVAYPEDSIALNVTGADLSTAGSNVTDTGRIVVELSSPNTVKVHCTYDVEFVWETDGYYAPTTTLASPHLYELSIKGQAMISQDTTGSSYKNINLAETNLSDFNWSNIGQPGSKATIVSKSDIYSNSTTATKAVWHFNVTFYSLPTDQSALLGKSYGAHLQVANVTC